MLQLPTNTVQQSKPSMHLSAASTKVSGRRAVNRGQTGIECMIAEHFRATRARRQAELNLAAKVRKNPELEHRRPKVLMYTNREGIEYFGRWVNDWDRTFITLNRSSDSEPPDRVNFRKRCEVALPQHIRQRDEAGIEAAEHVVELTRAKELEIWRAIKKHVPSSLSEIRRLTRHVLKILADNNDEPRFALEDSLSLLRSLAKVESS